MEKFTGKCKGKADWMIEITNKNKYTIISDKEKDYIVDVSLNWWGWFMGNTIWLFSLKGYELQGEQTNYRQQEIMKKVKYMFLCMVCFILLILLSSLLAVFPVYFMPFQKLVLLICIFFASCLFQNITSIMEQKKFYKVNNKSKNDIVRLKIHFINEMCIVKIIVIDLLTRVLISVIVVTFFVIFPDTEGVLPFVGLYIACLPFMSETTKIPFVNKDIENIQIVKKEKCV